MALPVKWACRSSRVCKIAVSSSSTRSRSIISRLQRLEKRAVRIPHISQAAAHARAKIAARIAEHHHGAAGHVFAGVVPRAFDHHLCPGIAHTEPLARHAAHVCLAGGGPIERHVADDAVFLGGTKVAVLSG